MPTLDKLAQARASCYKLYQTTFTELPFIDRATFVFHTLTIDEYRYYEGLLQKAPSSFTYDLYEQIVDKCLVEHSLDISMLAQFPAELVQDIEFTDDSLNLLLELLPAGILASLANVILWFSYPKDWQDFNHRLNQARQEIHTSKIQRIIGFVCNVFGYKPEELEHMPFDILAKRVALAEIAVSSQPKIPLELEDPEKLARKQKRAMAMRDYQQDAQAMVSAAGQNLIDKELSDKINAKQVWEEQNAETREEIEEAAEERKKQIRDTRQRYMSKFIR